MAKVTVQVRFLSGTLTHRESEGIRELLRSLVVRTLSSKRASGEVLESGDVAVNLTPEDARFEYNIEVVIRAESNQDRHRRRERITHGIAQELRIVLHKQNEEKGSDLSPKGRVKLELSGDWVEI